MKKTILVAAGFACLAAGCSTGDDEAEDLKIEAEKSYGLTSSSEILVTSEQGDRLAMKSNIEFVDGQAAGTVVHVHPDIRKQIIVGIGSSFTESSAFVLAHLDVHQEANDRRHRVVVHRVIGVCTGAPGC